MSLNQHVVPDGDKWAVKGEGNEKYTNLYDTKREAVERATEIAKNKEAELIVHSQDGEIEYRNSYGNDPFPPKG